MKLWKKVLSAATAGVLCLGSVGVTGMQSVLESVGAVLSASANVPLYYDGTYGDLYYSITDNGEIEITGCNEDAVIVEIPSEIDGKPVTRIGECAFSEDCAGLTAIDIPDSVTSIGEGAFENCKKLVKVTIPNSVTSIGPAAFCNCENLTEITVPDSAAYIGEHAFWGTPWFAAKREENPLVIVSGIVIDGTTCTGSVVIPDGVTGIGGFAFADCESITEVTISDGVTNVRQYAFSDCENLTKITIPDSLTSVEIGAFWRTPWFAAKLEENPLVIVSGIVIDGTTCTGSVVIPDGVTGISDFAFSQANVTEVTIPDSVTNIGTDAFEECSNLTIYGYTGSYAETHAKENDIPFVSLGNATTTETTTTTTETTTETTTTTTTTTTATTEPTTATSDKTTETTVSTAATTTAATTSAATETTAAATDTTTKTTATTATTTTSTATTTNPETPTLAKGDVDNSGGIDSTDIFYTMLYIANVAVGNDGGLTAEQIAAADVDGNGIVDSTDSFYIMYYVALHGAGHNTSWEEVLAK